MIITAIKYRSNGQQEPDVFRFSGGAGALRHVVCFQSANSDAREKAAAALALVLNGTPSRLVSDAAIQIADSAGDTWVLTRGSAGFAVTRNGTALSREQVQASLLSALLDLDLAMGSEAPAVSGTHGAGEHIAAMMDVINGAPGTPPAIVPARQSGVANHEVSKPLPNDRRKSDTPDFKEHVESSVAANLEKIGKLLGAKVMNRIIESPRELLDLVATVEPMAQEIAAIQNQLKSLESPGAFSRDDQQRLEKLVPEIELIDKIKGLALPLLDPSEGISAIQDRLKAIDHELGLRLASSGVQQLPNLHHALFTREWRKALGALANLEAARALHDKWSHILSTAQDELDPLIAEHLHSIEQSIRRDDELSGELESSIQMLRVKMSPVPSCIQSAAMMTSQQQQLLARQQSGPATWFEKLKESINGPTPPTPMPVVRSSEFPPKAFTELLDATQVNLEATTKRLEVMQHHIAAIHSDIDSQRDGLAAAMQRLADDVSEAKKTWSDLSHEMGLGNEAADFRVEQLVDLLLNRLELVKLEEEKLTLREKMRDRLNRFETLERLIIEWRQLTNSQKAGDLSHPGIILGEARSIIRYRDEKQKIVTRLSTIRDRSKSIAIKLAELDQRAKALDTRWQNSLRALDLPLIGMTDPRWSEVIDAARHMQLGRELLREFDTICARATTLPPDVEMDEQAEQIALGKPVHVYNWLVNKATATEREEFLGFVRSHNGRALMLVLTSDLELTKLLQHHGSGRSIEVRQSLAIDAAKQPLLNTKARQAIAALTNPRK